MSKNLSGADYPLSKIFSSDFEYVIPPYQRPYAWTIDQASELFEDLHSFYQYEPDEEYFLGSVVLIKKENKPHSEVIDGQQRLITFQSQGRDQTIACALDHRYARTITTIT